jgi:alpha-N-arabinofuranosidase
MELCRVWASRLAFTVWVLCVGVSSVRAAEETIKVSKRTLHDGRINPMLFGNFIELLDDLVPGMRAEMLNDRGFEGVIPPANWVYYDGSPTFCDRSWEPKPAWSLTQDQPFTGRKCAKIVARGPGPSILSQSGLSVRQDALYDVSGWIRTRVAVRVQVSLETPAPDGLTIVLASADPWEPNPQYTHRFAKLKPNGSSNRASLVVRAIGDGTVWADQLSLQPEDSLQGWRADVAEAIKACRPALIRWGGSAVDPGAYRWKNGIGPRDRRHPFPNVNWGRIDSNDVGIDEFCEFCELVDAKPLVCVSFSDGPASAADLVQYCNGGPETEWGARRVANGHPEPYHVRYWQLGNEISGDDDAYIAKCKDFIASMKRADPSIVVVSSFPSQKVLDAIGKDLGYLAPHHYTRDLAYCEADFRKLSGMIGSRPDCGHLRLAVTEWNFTAGDWGLLRAKMLTLEGALHNARYLNLLCRYSNIVDIACRSNMTNSFCSGIIETKPSGLLKRPSYHVMKLYAEHALPKPLVIGKTLENVDVVGCASDDFERVCVFAVNSRREPVALSLDLSELGGNYRPLHVESVRDTLDRRQPDVMNHWEASDRVRTVRSRVENSTITLPAYSASAIECGVR